MIIRKRGKKKNLEVYTIYWVNGKRHYYVILDRGSSGFIALTEDECEIVDPSLNDRFVVLRNNDGIDMFIHWAAYEDNLLDGLLENQPEAMAEFERRLKENYRKNERIPGSPPLDMLRRSEKFPDATSKEGEYYFCPECCEANAKARDYDEAIRCQSCDQMYNCVP